MTNAKTTMKRSLSMILAVLMLVGMFPVSVFAENNVTQGSGSPATTLTSASTAAPPAASFIADSDHFAPYGTDGEVYLTADENGNVTVPADPVGKDGYVFGHWEDAENVKVDLVAGNSINVESNVEYHAKWKTFSVDFIVDSKVIENREVDVKIIAEGREVAVLGELPEVPSKANHKFDGWFLAEDVDDEDAEALSSTSLITDDVILVARYTSFDDLAVTDLGEAPEYELFF